MAPTHENYILSTQRALLALTDRLHKEWLLSAVIPYGHNVFSTPARLMREDLVVAYGIWSDDKSVVKSVDTGSQTE
jgi:hypothetical protein